MDKSTIAKPSSKIRPKLRLRTGVPLEDKDQSKTALECSICLESVDREYKLVRYGCCEGKMCRSCCVTLVNNSKFACPYCRTPAPFASPIKQVSETVSVNSQSLASAALMATAEEPTMQSYSFPNRSISEHHRLRALGRSVLIEFRRNRALYQSTSIHMHPQ